MEHPKNRDQWQCVIGQKGRLGSNGENFTMVRKTDFSVEKSGSDTGCERKPYGREALSGCCKKGISLGFDCIGKNDPAAEDA